MLQKDKKSCLMLAPLSPNKFVLLSGKHVKLIRHDNSRWSGGRNSLDIMEESNQLLVKLREDIPRLLLLMLIYWEDLTLTSRLIDTC